MPLTIIQATSRPDGYRSELVGSAAVADLILELSTDDVDYDYVRDSIEDDYGQDVKAVLQLVPLTKLKPGHADANVRSTKKESKYIKLDPKTMPPILVDKNGGSFDILDGNHRYRVAKKLGLSNIWAYVLLYKD